MTAFYRIEFLLNRHDTIIYYPNEPESYHKCDEKDILENNVVYCTAQSDTSAEEAQMSLKKINTLNAVFEKEK